jgi:RecB family exonuclease
VRSGTGRAIEGVTAVVHDRHAPGGVGGRRRGADAGEEDDVRGVEDAMTKYRSRVSTLLDTFWSGEVVRPGDVVGEEVDFELRLDPGDGSPAVLIGGQIDRIDRLPEGGIEVVDYKTGRMTSQKDVAENLQLSIYALACRDALDLGATERVTLYFTETGARMSTTRSDEQIEAARLDILERVSRIRAGDFAATPSADACRWCDYAAMCPERVR